MLRVGESKETAGPVASHEIGEFFQFPPMCCEDGIRIGITWLPEDVDQRDRPSLISKRKTQVVLYELVDIEVFETDDVAEGFEPLRGAPEIFSIRKL